MTAPPLPRRLSLSSVALSLSLTGCLVPPCELALGVGFGQEDAKVRAQQDPSAAKAPSRIEPSIVFQAGMHPLQLSRDMHRRSVDFGLGAVVDYTPHRRTMTALYVEGLGFFEKQSCGEAYAGSIQPRNAYYATCLSRFAVGGQMRLDLSPKLARVDPGMAFIARREVTTFTDDSSKSHSHAAVTFGELAAGVFVMGSFDAVRWRINAGFSLRLPAIAAGAGPDRM